ncbi:MAG: ACT domain-containing protein [Planctomycetota bacterium]|jgi:ACT domain-containing protein
MPRQYLTAEDVHGAGSKEILVDESTIVTPQALEVAEAAGIAIRTAQGAYTEPTPDRGPDASFAIRELPNLPEPGPGSQGDNVIVTAFGRNREGVLAEITSVLSEHKVGIMDVSQKVVGGHFHMVITADLSGSHTFRDLQERLACLGGKEDYVVQLMHDRVFRFMHRI